MKKYTVNQTEAAQMIGVCSDTLRLWRNAGEGPDCFETPGGRYRYPVSGLEAFMRPQKIRQQTTSQVEAQV